jgi:hypothetical protein
MMASFSPGRSGRCIYVGGLYAERDVLRNRAVSTAGNRWQRGFLNALRGCFDEVDLLAHWQERVFPFGTPLPRRGGFDWNPHRTFAVRYLNLPWLRTTTLRRGYARQIDRALAKGNATTLVICYNATPWSAQLAQRARKIHGVPAVCLHADFPEMHGDWSEFARVAAPFAGNVFFSHLAFMQSPVVNRFHLDGGFERATVREPISTVNGAITYAGNIAESKGVAKLVEWFKTMPGDGRRLQLFGKVDERDGGPRILRLCATDSRITYRGVVPYAELDCELSRAAVLVNPVDVKMRGNPLNFPSKLQHYLEMGPPVVSAMAEGIAPAYRELMYTVEKDRDSSEWCTRIQEAADESPGARAARIGRVEAFLRDHLWAQQVARFTRWVDEWRPRAVNT